MDNPAIVRDGRIVGDGPAAANIPGVVAGLDHLYRHYGSGKVTLGAAHRAGDRAGRRRLRARRGAAVEHREGRRFLEKYPESARIFLPGGEVPQPGDRFVNKDYADDAAGDRPRRRRHVLPRRHRQADCRRHGRATAASSPTPTWRSTAPWSARRCAGATAATRLLRRSAGVDRHPADRVAAGARPLHARGRRARHARRRLLAPRDRGVEGARPAAPRGRSRALAGGLRRASAARPCRALFRQIDPAQGLHLRAAGRRTTGRSRRRRRASAAAPRPLRSPTPRAMSSRSRRRCSTWGGTFYVSKGLGFLYNNHLRSSRTTPGAYGSLCR